MSNGTCGVGFKPVTTENECLLTIKNHEHPNGAKCYESEGEWLWYFPDTPRWEKQYACSKFPFEIEKNGWTKMSCGPMPMSGS